MTLRSQGMLRENDICPPCCRRDPSFGPPGVSLELVFLCGLQERGQDPHGEVVGRAGGTCPRCVPHLVHEERSGGHRGDPVRQLCLRELDGPRGRRAARTVQRLPRGVLPKVGAASARDAVRCFADARASPSRGLLAPMPCHSARFSILHALHFADGHGHKLGRGFQGSNRMGSFHRVRASVVR